MGSAHKCVSCKQRIGPRADNPHFPFCSERCKMVDLGRWMGEEYRVPGPPAGDSDIADELLRRERRRSKDRQGSENDDGTGID